MKKYDYYIYIPNLLALFLLIGILPVKAQDIHFSQFWNAPLELNPALTGVTQADARFSGTYKNQWASVPVGYTTFSGAFDKKWSYSTSQAEQFAYGILFHHDQAGDSQWSLSNVSGMLSYARKITRGVYTSIGGQVGVGQRSFELQNLTFDNQYNGEIFDPREITGETFTNTKKMFFDSHIGLNIRLQKDALLPKQRITDLDKRANTRTKLDIGLGIHHLNTPSQSFYEGGGINIPVRFDIYGLGAMKITEKFDILCNGLLRLQSEYREILLGTALRVHLSQKRAKELSVDIGVNLRLGDAAIPFIGLTYRNQWQAGLVYDINISPFEAATKSNGGPEFALIYMIKSPETPIGKLCPLF